MNKYSVKNVVTGTTLTPRTANTVDVAMAHVLRSLAYNYAIGEWREDYAEIINTKTNKVQYVIELIPGRTV